jgi:hypothetical protein
MISTHTPNDTIAKRGIWPTAPSIETGCLKFKYAQP